MKASNKKSYFDGGIIDRETAQKLIDARPRSGIRARAIESEISSRLSNDWLDIPASGRPHEWPQRMA